MKKLFALLLTAALLLSLAACGKDDSGSKNESSSDSAVTDGYLDPYGNLTFRAFTELTGEELVKLAEGHDFTWNETVIFAGEKPGFDRDYGAYYFQAYNDSETYWSYDDYKAADKGAVPLMGLKMRVKGDFPGGQDAVADVFAGMEIVKSFQYPGYSNDTCGEVLVKNDAGTEYLVYYFWENESNVELTCRTDAYFAKNHIKDCNSIEEYWNQLGND